MSMTFENATTKSVDVNGTNFVFRQIGKKGGVPVVFLHHLTAVLDDWDPRVVDGLAATHHVIVFDNQLPCLAASSFFTVKDVPLADDLVGVAINIPPVSNARTIVCGAPGGKESRAATPA